MAQDVRHLDATIADLEARRDHLNNMIESLRQIRDQGGLPILGHGTASTASQTNASEQELRHDSFFGMTLLEGIKKYLGITKQTRSAPDIAEALSRGGMKSAAKDFVSNVRTTLSKNEEFVKVNGEWGLQDWYPAMRKKPRSTSPEVPTESSRAKEDEAPKRKPKGDEAHVNGFSPESLKGRTLQLLNLHPTELFTAQKATEALKETHLPSVRASLCALVEAGMAARPEKGQYQAK